MKKLTLNWVCSYVHMDDCRNSTVDFGLSSKLYATAKGAQMRKPYWMAPEEIDKVVYDVKVKLKKELFTKG